MNMNSRIDLKIDKDTVIHVPTKKIAKRVSKVFESLGVRMRDGESYTERNDWTMHKEYTCYNPHGGSYGLIYDYEKWKYNIITAEEFLKLHGVKVKKEPIRKPSKPKIHILEDGYLSSLEERCNNWIDENNYEVQNIAFSAYPNGVTLYFYATITYVD